MASPIQPTEALEVGSGKQPMESGELPTMLYQVVVGAQVQNSVVMPQLVSPMCQSGEGKIVLFQPDVCNQRLELRDVGLGVYCNEVGVFGVGWTAKSDTHL